MAHFSRIHILLDSVAPVTNRMGKNFFWQGWGDPATIRVHLEHAENELLTEPGYFLKQLNQKPKVPGLFLQTYTSSPVKVHIKEEKVKSDHVLIKGRFLSPFAELLPEVCRESSFDLLLPRRHGNLPIPVCFLLSGTGEESLVYRRRNIGVPLLEQGIGSLTLMNPFYGHRKPQKQSSSRLCYVTDLLSMGSAIISETYSLMKWMCTERGLGPFGIAGYSMGGLMACLAGCVANKPLALIPLLSPHSAAPIFTEGIFKTNVEWPVLKAGLDELKKEGLALPEEDEITFMRRLLATTDLRNFPKPVTPLAVAPQWGEYDQFIKGSAEILLSHWGPSIPILPPLKGGHVTSYVAQTYEKTFSKTICTAFGALLRAYPAWECSRDWGGFLPVVVENDKKETSPAPLLKSSKELEP
eukprot:TRINITY_DN6080_c0_g1_i1.p1 TRINITY_DN6080_c0_g1~~TRINITY_DN6080_c0_g1_i1.p1  ORF type:complete len:412 (+),score=63.00 TRINITY_DN6080_c0_g1_i1:81-1316(+)